MWFLLFLLPVASEACQCAPLASCVRFDNGTWGCVCPYYGDGYTSCEEHRFVTDVVVRSKSEIEPWLKVFSTARVSHMSQRKLLSETQYVLELDSTNYESMISLTEQINLKRWPYQVALMGSATCRIVNSLEFQETPPHLEITNISFSDPWWSIDLVANDGMLFLGSAIAPLPCIHNQVKCCVMDYAFHPFKVGFQDMNSSLRKCVMPITNATQPLSNLTSYIDYGDHGLRVKINTSELWSIAVSDPNHFNFSVGLLTSDMAATQVFVSLSRTYSGYSIGTFTRQVATFVMMQVELVETTFYIRCWAQLTLTNASVVSVQYAWGNMEWIEPICVSKPACFDVPQPCKATTSSTGMLELWVPINNHHLDYGNLSLYFVVQQDKTLARVLTQSKPDVVTVHCQELAFTENIELQILQGLQLKQIYRGPILNNMELNIEPQTDTLITLVARSTRGAMIQDLRAIHTRTQEERQLVASNKQCTTCVMEQLVLEGRVVSPRSCFLFGTGDESKWIQNYVGLVGSSLAFDILARLPSDMGAAAWVNPVWPWATDEDIKSVTFLHVKFDRTQGRTSGRRLLYWSSHHTLRAQWCMIASTAFLLLVWYYISQ